MSHIKKNFAYNLIYQILLVILPVFTTPYLARVLGAEKTGIYSYEHSIASYFVMFAMLGFGNYGNREIARVRDSIENRSSVFWSVYILQVCTSLTTIIAYFIYCIIFKKHNSISWLLSLYVMSTFLDINWFFWGMEQFQITVTRNTIVKILSVAAILFLVKSPDDLLLYVSILTGSQVISQLVLWVYLKNYVIWIKPSFKEIGFHFKPVVVLFIPVIAVSLYKVMDKIMLGSLATFTEVGYYEYAEKVIAIPISCVNALGTVMLPRMSNLVANKNNSEENEVIRKSIIIGSGITISMGFGLMGIAKEFVPFFYGIGYDKCIPLFYILMPSCFFLAVANVIRTQYLIPRGKDKEYIISVLIGAAVNLTINRLLIPNLQSIGAATGTLLAEASVCIYQLYIVRNHLPVLSYVNEFIVLLLMGTVLFAVVALIPSLNNYLTTIIIKILVGIVLFGIMFTLKYKDLVTYILKKRGENA